MVDIPEWFRSRLGRRFRLVDRERAYNLALRTASGAEVLTDWAEFSRYGEIAPTGMTEFETGRYIGRQDMFIRAQQHLCLSHEELYHILHGRGRVVLNKGEGNGT